MAEQFNPLDPLGILEPVGQFLEETPFGTLKIDQLIDQFIESARLPGPPGLARRTEAERATRHGGTPPPRGTGYRRMLDPLGLFQS